ncbi:MAG: HDIG domain-containing protein [Saprospiraceae bacterium]|nr:MAG: HDIG domain-containing protein [Saprospiraceae bacterium]
MSNKWQSTFSNFDRIGKYGLVGATVLLISFLYPNRAKFKYEFQKGQRWSYETLAAPYDFAINKSVQKIKEDRERLEKEFTPYYRLNSNLPTEKLQLFENDCASYYLALGTGTLNAGVHPISRFAKAGKRLLEGIYQQGVIEIAPEHEKEQAGFVINVVQGNNLERKTLASLLTVESAKEILADSLRRYFPHADSLYSLLMKAVAPNLIYDAVLTQQFKAQALEQLVTTKGIVRQGNIIITKGAVVSDDDYEKLVSFKAAFEANYGSSEFSFPIYLGYLLLTIVVFWVFTLYVIAYRREIFRKWLHLVSILIWPLIFCYLTFLLERVEALSALVIPFCIVPIIVRHFFTYRLAFFTHVIVVLLAGFITSVGYQFTFIQIVAGVVAVLTVADARYWSKFFMSVLYILLTYMVSYLGLAVIEEGGLQEVDWSMFGWLFFNALLTLLAFPLIPLMERTFGFTSSISLVELSDMNRPLMRLLSIKAPGTLQHSIQVANMAEAAANKVGADALLVRTGAMYHDIGKTFNPEYFIENQTNRSPHEDLNSLQSADIIIRHVTEGASLAKKHHLPQTLIDFILTHHGTTRVEFFYRTFKNENPGLKVEEAKFTYPGPKPRTKEEGILMLADSIEATSRSLKNPTVHDIDKLVDSTIAAKIEQKQLEDCKITFKDVEQCRSLFKKMLHSIYHVRIEYPEDEQAKKEVKPAVL